MAIPYDDCALIVARLTSGPRLRGLQPSYLPTLEEIREQCERFQSAWPDGERWERYGYKCGYELPRCSARTLERVA